jgi:hypothetical protein
MKMFVNFFQLMYYLTLFVNITIRIKYVNRLKSTDQGAHLPLSVRGKSLFGFRTLEVPDGRFGV